MNTTKQNLSKIALLGLFAGIFMTACNSPKKMSSALEKVKFKADPQVLEVKGDSITVKITGKFPAKTFAKNASIKFQPILRYGTQEKPLPPKYLVGEKVTGVPGATKVSYEKGGGFTYYQRVEYTPEMKKSMLTLDYTVKFSSKYEELDQCVSGSKKDSLFGTITTALSVNPTDDLYYYDNTTPLGGARRVIFYYVINEGFLRDSVFKGPAVQTLETLTNDPKFKINNITLHSYASPDGELKRNLELTHERAESAYKEVKTILEKEHVNIIKDEDIFKKPDENGDDWAGLKRMISASNMAGKDELMAVINNNMNFDEKNAALKKLASWNDLKDNYLPKLRRTEVYLEGTFPNRDITEVRSIAANSFDGLTKKEVISYANNATDNASKEKAYKYLMNKYPDDWAGENNYATILLKEGNYKDADSLLAMAHKTWPNNDTIASNLGVADREMHKYDDAKALYGEAAAKNMKEGNNMGILYIKYGDYDNAVASFDPKQCDYNVALAYTMKNDYDNALSKIDCISDKTPEVYYLRAIVAARKGDVDLMTTSLTLAVKGDASYRDQAKSDIEFKKYWTKVEFQNAIK